MKVKREQRLRGFLVHTARNWLIYAATVFTLLNGCEGTDTNTTVESIVSRQMEMGKMRVPIAILGDSDSHSYHDNVRTPRGSGEYKHVTFQWTEVLHRLRGDQVDLGAWGLWGSRRSVATLLRLFNVVDRSPKKEDFEYNLAMSGAVCSDLTATGAPQTPSLLKIIEREPDKWSRGLIVIRIGINSVERPRDLEIYAKSGLNAEAEQKMDECIGYIKQAVELIRTTHGGVRMALVGLFEEPNAAPLSGRWQSRHEIANICAVLDYFDRALQRLADQDARTIFVDDRAWWKQYWGDRDANGIPHYRSLNLGGSRSITNTQGDHPANLVIADGHAGTVQNALWAGHLIQRINEAFGLNFRALLNSEIAKLVDPDGDYGIRAANG